MKESKKTSIFPRNLSEKVHSRLPVTSLRGFRKCITLSQNRSFTKRHFGRAKATTKKKMKLPAKLTDLPRDLTEEVLSNLPMTSMRRIRKCNTLSQNRSSTKRHFAQAKAATKKKKKKKELPANLTDLPRDLTEELLSRLPVTSLRGIRSTCKKWNTLSKDLSFTKNHLAQVAAAAAAKELTVVMVMNFRVYLLGIDLHGIHPSINPQAKLISLDGDVPDISEVYHCDGLLLCITKDLDRFVVWNPYSFQTLWLKPRCRGGRLDLHRYAIGYEDNNSGRKYKVLRFFECMDFTTCTEYEIYDLDSNSWRVLLDVTSDWAIEFYARGVSLKGNTYWFAQYKYPDMGPMGGYYDLPDCLICFDFTAERFGPQLHLPFHSKIEDTVTLSSVREEQLAVLFQPWDTLRLEIWVTTKIEPQVAMWSKVFLSVPMQPLTDFQFLITKGSFFIDQDKKVAVVFDKDKNVNSPTRNTAYIIGEDGYYREVDLGVSTQVSHYPIGCSYVPSSAQIKQGGQMKKILPNI